MQEYNNDIKFYKISVFLDDVYNPNRNRKVLIVFDEMTGDIMTSKKFKPHLRNYFFDAGA